MPSVVQAIAAVMADLPAIGKGDKSPEGYSYRGIEAITKHLQPLLAKHGVVIVPSATLGSVQQSPEMKPGWQDVYLNVAWKIYGPDGEFIEAHTCGIGRDRADKGVNKAQTQAYKYLLLHMLSIADKADDTDGSTYDDHRQAAPRRGAMPKLAPPDDDVHTDPNLLTHNQLKRIVIGMKELGLIEKQQVLTYVAATVGRQVDSRNQLTPAEAGKLIDQIENDLRSEMGS